MFWKQIQSKDFTQARRFWSRLLSKNLNGGRALVYVACVKVQRERENAHTEIRFRGERERERERESRMERSAVLAGLQPNQLLCPYRRHPSTPIPSFPFAEKPRSSPSSLKVLLLQVSFPPHFHSQFRILNCMIFILYGFGLRFTLKIAFSCRSSFLLPLLVLFERLLPLGLMPFCLKLTGLYIVFVDS